MDLWVRPTAANARRVWRGFAAFGAPLADLTPKDLATPGTVLQIGVAPIRVDILTAVEPLAFAEAWTASVQGQFAGIPVRILGRDHLLSAKRFANRLQDRLDVRALVKAAAVGPATTPRPPSKRRRRT